MKMPIRGAYSLFLLLVLFLHVGLLILKIKAQTKIDRPENEAINVRIINEVPKHKKQIVQSEDSSRKKIEEDAFLSDKDRSFDRQTKARNVDIFRKSGTSGGQPHKNKDVKLSDLGLGPKEADPFKKLAKEYSKKKQGATNDHVEKIPLGDLTNLNTQEFKYFGFYHRIRQRLEQFWGRSIHETAEELLRGGRTLASSEEHVTSLKVVLNAKGKIISISIVGSSGVRELDEAAIESFNEAGPFPNPPKGLLVGGRVTIEWGFVVQT